MRDFPDDEVITAVGASSGLRGFPFDESLYLKPRFAPFFDGLAQYVQLSEAIVIPPNVDFYIEVKMSGLSNNSYQSIFSGPTIDNFYRTLPGGEGIQSYAGSYAITWSTSNFDASKTQTYALHRVNNVLSIVIDGESKSSRSNSTQQVVFDRLIRAWTTSAYSSGTLEHFKVSIGGTLTNLIEFNQKNQAVQVPSVGSISAMIINHTDAMWRNV